MLQKVYPHFSVMPHGLVHESEEKLRAHFFAHGDPLSDWTTCRDSVFDSRREHLTQHFL